MLLLIKAIGIAILGDTELMLCQLDGLVALGTVHPAVKHRRFVCKINGFNGEVLEISVLIHINYPYNLIWIYI